jgi:hypothetical protein
MEWFSMGYRRKIAISAQDGKGLFDFSDESPWGEFQRVFQEAGWDIVKDVKDAEFIINLNHHMKILKRITKKIPIANRALIMFEPIQVNPRMHSSRTRNLYGSIYVPSVLWKMNNEHVFNWPNSDKNILDLSRTDWKDRKKGFAFIQSNNFSFVEGENYSLRRKVLHMNRDDIFVAGSKWTIGFFDYLLQAIKPLVRAVLYSRSLISLKGGRLYAPKIRHFTGVPRDKFAFLSEFQFSLVIENCESYISEKLIDAVIAGTVPLYVGSELRMQNIPEEIAHVAEPSAKSILEAMEYLLNNRAECDKILAAGEKFLKSDKYLEFLNHN